MAVRKKQSEMAAFIVNKNRWWYGNEKNYHPVGRQPILKDKTSEKNRIKIQKRGKPAKKVFSFLIQNWYKKGGKCA